MHVNRINVLRSLLGVWLEQRGRQPDWSRAINPSGEQLHLNPPGLSVLVLDSAIEGHEPVAIVHALAAAFEGRFAENIRVTIRSDLTIVVH